MSQSPASGLTSISRVTGLKSPTCAEACVANAARNAAARQDDALVMISLPFRVLAPAPGGATPQVELKTRTGANPTGKRAVQQAEASGSSASHLRAGRRRQIGVAHRILHQTAPPRQPLPTFLKSLLEEILQQYGQSTGLGIAHCMFVECEQRRPHVLKRIGRRIFRKFVFRFHSQRLL